MRPGRRLRCGLTAPRADECAVDLRSARWPAEREVYRMADFKISAAAFAVEPDPQGRFWNSRWNLHPEVLAQYSLPKQVTITDSTIREGEETPHVVYTLEQKLRIARLLDEMNVHEIDCGFASSNQGHLDFLTA